MIIEEVAPTLTCEKTADGFLYELLLRADPDKAAITKVRIGPYFFKPEHQPKKSMFGLMSGGPENGFWMHKATPPGWSRWNWEVDDTQQESPSYLYCTGSLSNGNQGRFQFISIFAPGGIRVGLELFRDKDHHDYGVTGPNYEEFFSGDHEH